jgi:transcriptional regulator with XRE-family HTH domain
VREESADDVEVTFGEELQILRSSVGWTQAELARKARIRASALSRYESDKQFPEIPTLLRILDAMEYRLTELDTARDFLASLKRTRGRRGRNARPALLEATEPLRPRPAADQVRAAAEEAGYPLPEDRARAPELWERLRKYSHEARLALVAEMRDFQVWSLCELLSHESEMAAAEDPGAAVDLARLALEVADRVPGEESQHSRLRGYARHHFGNALRAQGELRAARPAFAQAEEEWKAGEGCPGDLLSETRVLDLKASFRTAERKLPEALDLLNRALADDEPGMRGRLLIKKAKILEEQDDLEAAIATLKEAEPFVDEHREPRLLLCLRHNLLDYQSKVGRFKEAEALLPEVRPLSLKLGKELDRVRLRWAEGRVAAGLGRTQEGIEHLTRVRGEFVSREIWYDAALVTMELAAVFLREGQTGMVKTLAAHLKPIFQAQGVHVEAMAALTLFAKAAEKEKATLEMAQGIVTYLRKARRDPGLKFQGVA